MADSELAPKFAPFFGMAGIASAVSSIISSSATTIHPPSSPQINGQTLEKTSADEISKMIFGSIGAAYGTAKAGIGIAGVGTFRPDLMMKSLIPVVMAGIIAVYGLVVAVLIAGDLAPPPQKTYSLFSGAMHLAAGLSVGLAGLSAGYTIGLVGDMGVRSYMQQSRVFVGMVLILIFGEVLGLYGYGSPRSPRPPTPSSHTGSLLLFKQDGMDGN
ncbi:hypothetical protein PAAG_04049 [Paracoccidioides lutzii Pb01]|uniref:V-type proton ATPase proteolipid subunit n=1 Tax=Paracoccidioides lutzii (strain ATCC MYA-826 / Pb01) TaxID=502779 RepID=C1GZV5_PARBA|nr:hypothetical protein PAAG_04049 [Paracoccidioides lutzii Pb01]EEH32996.2 hypothetical protein PAAG_04049 [Paracoccidioides lutzii Pb01]